jgi:hypothetical protein
MAERVGLPQAITATGKRQAGIKSRLAEHGEEGWRKAVAAVERSSFCRGENNRGWRADIGFMIRPDNFAKLIEGGFDPKGITPIGRATSRPMTVTELRSAIAFAEDNDNPERAAECRRMLAELQAKPRGPAADIISQVSRGMRAEPDRRVGAAR